MGKETMKKLRDMMCDELDEMAKHPLDEHSLEIIGKLLDGVKDIDKIETMESEKGESYRGYSRAMGSYRGSYADGDWQARGSYADGGNGGGGGYSGKRDSMGRYSRAGGDMIDMLRDLERNAANERERETAHKIMEMI